MYLFYTNVFYCGFSSCSFFFSLFKYFSSHHLSGASAEAHFQMCSSIQTFCLSGADVMRSSEDDVFIAANSHFFVTRSKGKKIHWYFVLNFLLVSLKKTPVCCCCKYWFLINPFWLHHRGRVCLLLGVWSQHEAHFSVHAVFCLFQVQDSRRQISSRHRGNCFNSVGYKQWRPRAPLLTPPPRVS